ncbi:MAG: beta-N-acetylhexosaminidase [Phycisphaerales bacterium]|nr:beta-N-acetylhexosaminidase [Phycisphaerales bacterium]
MHAAEAETLVRPLLWIGFDGRTIPTDTARLVKAGVSGVILFARNCGTRDETRALIDELRAQARGALLLSVDQEGGRVARLTEGFEKFPSLRELAALDASAVRAIGSRLGAQVRDAGFDVDLAPVLDVDSNPLNPVIGDRSFSRDAETVARLGVAMTLGLQEHVAACGKHFPGHGDTDKDSHFDLPRLAHARARLDAVELLPFRAAIAAGIECIMTTHVVFDAVDAGVPATMSAKSIEGLLRAELSFEGVVVSDDLEMKAIADHFGVGSAAVRAISAGVDALLVCHSAERQSEAIEALAKAVLDGTLPIERVQSARARLQRLAKRRCAP